MGAALRGETRAAMAPADPSLPRRAGGPLGTPAFAWLAPTRPQASTLAVAQISALVVGGAHLLRRADRTEDDALELVRVGSVPLRLVDPQARRFINDNARCLLVELGALGLIREAESLVEQRVNLRVLVVGGVLEGAGRR